MQLQSLTSGAKATKEIFSEKNVTFLAGSIAYSAFVSLVPLVMFFLLAVSLFGVPELQQQIITLATDNVSPSVGGVIEVMITQQSSAGTGSAVGASIIGVLTLVWGAIKVFRGLDTAFSEIYETTTRESFVGQLKKSVLVLLTLTLGVIAMVGATSVVAFFSFVPFIGLVVPLLLVVGLIVAFFPMYYLFPDIDVEPRAVLPGVLVGAVGWALLQVLFQLYVSVSGGGGNLIASILLLVTWLYFSGVVLLLGAVVNAVAIGRTDEILEGESGPSIVDTTMDRDEAAAYFRQLREDLTGRFEGSRSTRTDSPPKRDPPRETVSVVEAVRADGEAKTHEVRLRWQSHDKS
ncbi:YihY/virulence factor BrkB family protein [Halogeometricum luteum]|uniref:YihY/virulence factor BrkB family protein n=1 Tax=Halogeometricum luteum TaxID=2950537 RepID=A0ABU2G2C0_9EURY|nr:YihY/virulence factor BrkB family protein [Halogeometricum sp. S3BR5-2]MDS0294925.1 YihY/virulence factor BrkB family protein [Halogeometricum sp. S3BR5-2]